MASNKWKKPTRCYRIKKVSSGLYIQCVSWPPVRKGISKVCVTYHPDPPPLTLYSMKYLIGRIYEYNLSAELEGTTIEAFDNVFVEAKPTIKLSTVIGNIEKDIIINKLKQ